MLKILTRESLFEDFYGTLCDHLEARKLSPCGLRKFAMMMRSVQPSFSRKTLIGMFQEEGIYGCKKCLHEEILAAAYRDIVNCPTKNIHTVTESEVLSRLHRVLMPQWTYFVWISDNTLFESKPGIFERFTENITGYCVRIPENNTGDHWFFRDT